MQWRHINKLWGTEKDFHFWHPRLTCPGGSAKHYLHVKPLNQGVIVHLKQLKQLLL